MLSLYTIQFRRQHFSPAPPTLTAAARPHTIAASNERVGSHPESDEHPERGNLMSKRIPPVLARLGVLCLCLAFSALNAIAQSQATTGDIEGRVLDPNGAVVPNATVTARNQATGFERTANTDGDGNYRIVLLPPGTYSVEATAGGFNKVGANAVQVTVGSKTSLDLSLTTGGVREEMIIS